MSTQADRYPVTDVNRVRRLAERGQYAKEDVFAIVDRALVVHVGFIDDGRPVIIPMTCARDGETVILHGARKSRLTEAIAGQPVCLSIAFVDGLVYARSVYHSSMNYRSAVLFGTARRVEGEEARLQALKAMAARLMPGRWDEVRPPLPAELKATELLRVEIDSASAKVRSAQSLDDRDAYTDEQWTTTWAGILPVATAFGRPIPDPAVPKEVVLPRSVASRTQAPV